MGMRGILLLTIIQLLILLKANSEAITNCLIPHGNNTCSCCKSGYRGPTCSVVCQHCLTSNIPEGNCTYYCETGYYGNTCDKENVKCFPGYYGTQCDQMCDTNCEGRICYPIAGKCLWCRGNEFYGDHCRLPCSQGCVSGRCNRTGYCTDGCKSGFYGERCESQCGRNCQHGMCTSHGNHTYNCTGGCHGGYWGTSCLEKCPNHCKECEQQSGRCTLCVENYVEKSETGKCVKVLLEGKHAVADGNNLVIAAIVVIVVIIISGIIIVVIWKKRRHRHHRLDEWPENVSLLRPFQQDGSALSLSLNDNIMPVTHQIDMEDERRMTTHFPDKRINRKKHTVVFPTPESESEELDFYFVWFGGLFGGHERWKLKLYPRVKLASILMDSLGLHKKDGRLIYPMDVECCLLPSIRDRVRSMADIQGTVVYLRSPLLMFMEEDLRAPQNVVCDVFVLRQDNKPMMLLTFAWRQDHTIHQYHSRLVHTLQRTCRKHTGMDISVMGVVIDKEHWDDDRRFQDMLEQEEFHSTELQPVTGTILNLLQDMTTNQRLSPTRTDMFSQFVGTAAYKTARDQLQQWNVLILTGGPGEGKTTIGHRLCYDYHQQGYNTVFYSRQQDINWDVLKTTKPTLMVCDNVTDDDFRERLKHGNDCVQVVVVSGTVYSKRYAGYPTVNVSDIHKQNMDRTKHDYIQMLQMNNLGILESTQNEIISKLPSYVGFPKAVKLYRKYKHCVDPVTYFTYPLHYFIGEMENMAETSDMEEWVYLLLCGGNCDDDDDDDDDVWRSMQQLFQHIDREVMWNVKERLRQYIGGYLDAEIIEGRERVYFSHPAIYDACLFVVDRKYPGFLWKHCKVVFEREEEQSHIRLPKLTVFISKHNTDMFLTQIVEDLKQGKFRHSLSHEVLRTQENIDRLFTQLGDRLKDIVKAEEDSGSFLYWVAQSDNQDLMNAVLDKPDFTQADVNKALINCIRTNHSKPFHLLRGEFMNKIGHNLHYNSDLYSLLMAAVERDNLTLVDVIVRDMDDLLMKNNDGNTALHLVCLTGNTEVVKYVLSRMRGSKDLPGQELRTPVMMAALKGHGQLYEYLADVEKCHLTGVDDNGDTILHLACVGGNLNIVKHLVTGGIINKNQRGQHGKTPLMIAAYCKHKDIFDWLVGQKCDISPLDFSIKDLVSYGGVNHSTSLHVFLNSRELGSINKVHRGSRYERSMLPSSKGLEYAGTKVLVKHLESKGSNMLFEDESGMSLLHTAANTGHLELADFLLSKGNVDINIRDGRGRTPVMLAVPGGHGQMFDFLLDRGADLSLKDEISSGILHFACQGSNRSVMDQVMEHGFTDVNSRNDDMKTPLSYAVETGDKQIFNTVFNRGGDLSVVDRDKNTLLHLACKGGNLAIVEHLLSLGMLDIDAVNREHRTPLLVAAYSGHTDVCHHLICVGADLHIQDRDGNDVLLVAAYQGMKELTEYILMKSKGRVINKDKSGKTAPMKAAKKGHYEVFRVMMDHGGFDPSTRDHMGNSILNVACIGGNEDIVKYILSQNIVDINNTGTRGRTPVMRAAEKGHRGVIDLLVREGCDLSVVDRYGDNILHVACSGGNVDIVKYILSQNIVDINSKGRRGRTPVMMAEDHGHTAVVDLLRHHGGLD